MNTDQVSSSKKGANWKRVDGWDGHYHSYRREYDRTRCNTIDDVCRDIQDWPTISSISQFTDTDNITR